jgi:hypothetical protein
MSMDLAPAKSSSTTLLRHRFETIGALQRHLHPIEGRSFLFFRSESLVLAGGARVLLEVNFTSNEQQTVLRGQVLGRVEGAHPGLWLEFPDTRLLKKADEGAIASRKQRRVGCDVLIEVRKPGCPSLGRLVDISLGGARFAGMGGLRIHEQVEVRVVSANKEWPSELGRAQVVRMEDHDIGTKFLRDQPQSRMAITRLFGALQEGWVKAPEVSHPASCCRNGQLFEPPLPRVKGRERPL